MPESVDILVEKALVRLRCRERAFGHTLVIFIEKQIEQRALVLDVTKDRAGAKLCALADHP